MYTIIFYYCMPFFNFSILNIIMFLLLFQSTIQIYFRMKMVRLLATIFPENPEFSTIGEELFYKNVLSSLTDDWIVFYEPLVQSYQPDFIVFQPNIGISVIEIKDYKNNTIIDINPKNWVIHTEHGAKTVTSPVEQAIRYRNNLINYLSKDKDLTSKTHGRLVVPISILCCFPFISKKDLKYSHITQLISEELLLVKEDMNESTIFISKFTKSFKRLFAPKIQESERKKIIQHLYPSFKFDAEKEEHFKQTFNQILEKATLKKFDNYVEELFFVVDSIAHLLNTSNTKMDEILIVYNKKRALLPNAAQYIETLYEYLDHKNISISDVPNKGSILICTYNDLVSRKQTLINKKIIFFIDFNQNSLIILDELFLTNNLFKLDANLYITTNQFLDIN